MQHKQEFETMALLYAYGELDAAKEPAFLEHLKSCPACQGVVRACALATAAFEDIKAPAFTPAPATIAAPQPQGIWQYLAPLFTPRRLAPAASMAVLIGFLSVAAIKYGTVNVKTEDFVDNMHAEITNIETSIDDIFTGFDNLQKHNNLYLQEE